MTSDRGQVSSMRPQRLPRIGVLAQEHVGPVIARVAIAAGYPVSIASSGDPDNIALITQVLVPGAEPRWTVDAVQSSDIVVLAIPLHRFATFDPSLVAGKIVVDAMNYWPPVDGARSCWGPGSGAADRRTEAFGSTVVKTLNQIEHSRIAQTVTRRVRGSGHTSARWRRLRHRCRGHRVGGHRAHRLRRRPAGQPSRRTWSRTGRPGLRCVLAPSRVRGSTPRRLAMGYSRAALPHNTPDRDVK